MSGSLLSYIDSFSDEFSKALENISVKGAIEKNVLVLDKLDGFMGALGALQKVIGQ